VIPTINQLIRACSPFLIWIKKIVGQSVRLQLFAEHFHHTGPVLLNASQRQSRFIALGLAALAAAVLVLVAVAVADPPEAEVAALPAPENGHRPLRSHPQDKPPSGEPSQAFTGYPGAPDISVLGRIDELSFYPCSMCHAEMPANPERRELMAPHQIALDHGDGRMWCLDCHAPESRDQLATLAGERLSFDEADRVCSQCHADVHQDWAFGVHGKRVGRWQGPREIYSCAHCHDPHDPGLRPRAPEPPPPVRAGLEPMPHGDYRDNHRDNHHNNHHQPLYPWFGHDAAEPELGEQETENEEDPAG